jgi:hypothetical protein
MQVPMPLAVLIGSLITLWGSLVLVIGMAESYDKHKRWRKWLSQVGTLFIVLGTAVSFYGSATSGISGADARIRPWGQALVALTVVVGLGAPRAAKWWGGDRAMSLRQRPCVRGLASVGGRGAPAIGLRREDCQRGKQDDGGIDGDHGDGGRVPPIGA